MRFRRIERRLWEILCSQFSLKGIDSGVESVLQAGELRNRSHDGWGEYRRKTAGLSWGEPHSIYLLHSQSPSDRLSVARGGYHLLPLDLLGELIKRQEQILRRVQGDFHPISQGRTSAGACGTLAALSSIIDLDNMN
jgi:hypothetical protein